MKRVTAGVGPTGGSAILQVDDVGVMPGAGGVGEFDVWSTASLPPTLPKGRKAGSDAVHHDLGVAASGAVCRYAVMGPGFTSASHLTDSYDIVTVVAGTIELVLDEGSILLAVGDCVLMPGVAHIWRAGPDGGVFLGVAFGAS